MTSVLPTDGAAATRASSARQLRVLLFSDDVTVRDTVRASLGRRPTADAVVSAADAGGFELLILDGEAAKNGGLGLCRQLKNEIFNCPPVIVLTGRPQDGWLASWSQADRAVPHPLDPVALAKAVADIARVAR